MQVDISKAKKVLDILTGYRIAQALGVSEMAVSKWKKGTVNFEDIKLKYVIELAKLYSMINKEETKMEKVVVKYEGKKYEGSVLKVAQGIISDIGNEYSERGASENFYRGLGHILDMSDEVFIWHRVLKDMDELNAPLDQIDAFDHFMIEKMDHELEEEVKRNGKRIFDYISSHFGGDIEIVEDDFEIKLVKEAVQEEPFNDGLWDWYYEPNNHSVWGMDAGMEYSGDDTEAYYICQSEDGEILN